MNWSDKDPLVYSCYYNSELLGYLEYPYMGQEEYPTTIRADIIKHFKLPKGYNPKEISWRYIENDPLDETKPLVKVNESLTEEGNLDRLLDSDEFKTPVSEEEIDAARKEVAKESLKEKCGKQKITEESEVEENTEDDSTAPTIYHLFLDDKLVYESESIPLDKALSEITAYIKKLTQDQKKSFSLSWEFDESGYYNKPIYDNKGNIVGSRNDFIEVDGDVIVGVFSEAECKEYGYAFPEERFVVNVDYAGDAIRKAFDANVTTNLKEEKADEPEVEENTDDDSTASTRYYLFLEDKKVYESESIPLNKALSEITTYIKKLTPEQKKSFSLSWEFDDSGYYNTPIYDNEGNIVGSRNDFEEISGDTIVGVFSEAECKEYGYAFPEERFVVNVDYAGDTIRKALDADVTANLNESSDEESEEVEIEDPEFNEDDIDELDECSLNKHIDEYFKEVYSNVKSYETTGCELKEGNLIVEGKISFNSGKEELTMFEFLPAYCEGNLFFEGYNKDFSEDKAFTLNCSINKSKTLVTESFGYKYKINENLVEGLK